MLCFVTPTDPDVWWHLRDGQLIAASGIPSHDVYSYTATGRTWLVQEWLTELIMYGLKQTFGYLSLTVLFAILQAVSAWVVWLLLRRFGASRIVALLLLLLYLTYAAPTWGVRPQVLNPILLGGFYLILLAYREQPQRARLLWLLPIITIFWVNLHASYFIGVGLVGAFLVGELINNWLYRPAQRTPTLPLLLTLTGCLLATLLNPYFLQLWTYPLTYVTSGTSNPLLRYTQEWQSPNFHDLSNLVLVASFVLLALVGITNSASDAERGRWRVNLSRRIDITELIILAVFTFFCLQAVRLMPVYGVMVLPLLAGGLARTWPVLSRDGEQPPTSVEGWINVGVAVVATAVMLLLFATTPSAQTATEPRTDTEYAYPAAAANYIATLPPGTRLYNNFAWGGYLIYRLYPQHFVFIDGRADMYREGIFDDFMVVQNVGVPWRSILDRYGVNTVIWPPGTPLDYALAHEPGWHVGYRDSIAIVYQKN